MECVTEMKNGQSNLKKSRWTIIYFDYISTSLVFSEHNLNKLLIFDGFKYENYKIKDVKYN